MFLTQEDLRTLTGKAQKAKQAEQLRRMGIPFYLNASGHPIVARSAIEGGRLTEQPKPTWRSTVLGS